MDFVVYLLNFLEDEFRDYRESHGVRVRPLPKAGTERSPDLVQDYDPEANDLHLKRGVLVQTRRKEFYFPIEWAQDRHYDKIRAQIEVIRDSLA